MLWTVLRTDNNLVVKKDEMMVASMVQALENYLVVKLAKVMEDGKGWV